MNFAVITDLIKGFWEWLFQPKKDLPLTPHRRAYLERQQTWYGYDL